METADSHRGITANSLSYWGCLTDWLRCLRRRRHSPQVLRAISCEADDCCPNGTLLSGSGGCLPNPLRSHRKGMDVDVFHPAKGPCRLTFVFDPAGTLYYWWTAIVSMSFVYNLWVIIYRYAFDEIQTSTAVRWLSLDYFADFLYLVDIIMHFRTGYLEEGVLQTQPDKLWHHYVNTTVFYVDCFCLLPLDFLYLSLGYQSIVRLIRLVKVYRFFDFIDKTERHTNYPNVVRLLILFHYVVLIFHWNACLVYSLRSHLPFSPIDNSTVVWRSSDSFHNYLFAYYVSCRALTLVESLPTPSDKGGFVFVIAELVFGLLLFASILGHISNIVSNTSAARKAFQGQLDRVKTYMNLRGVPWPVQMKVIRWFDYLWSSKKTSDETQVMVGLPDKLKAEIAIHVHLDTLKRVEIFQNTEPGFLCDLVLKLRPMLFSPGDYVCRKGEVGKEMYIVNRGKLQVLSDGNCQVLAVLSAGSYFGEISILNMGTEGNKRTASVVSVGYSDLFCLSKKDIWAVLEDYPAARERLEFIAQKRLHQPQSTVDRKTKNTCDRLSTSWRSVASQNQSGIGSCPSRSADTLPLTIRRVTPDPILRTPTMADQPITHSRSKEKLKSSGNLLEVKQPESYI